MTDELLKLRSNEALLRTMRETREPSRLEMKEQRVSFVYGSLDSKNSMTREQVRKMVESAS